MNIRGFFTKKKIIWLVIIILVIGFIGYQIKKSSAGNSKILTDTVKVQDLKQTVLATGQVVSSTDLDLSFKASGFVQKVAVKEVSKVKGGDVLASLDAKDVAASITSAQGSLAAAQANYQKVLAGASNEEVLVAQRAMDSAQAALRSAQISFTNTKQQQNTAVANALSALLNTPFQAVPATSNVGSPTVGISGTYMGTDQGVYKVSVYGTGQGLRFQVSGLETGDGEVRSAPVPLGTHGLFISFTGNTYSNDSWTITIPNTLSPTYVTYFNAYQAAVKNQASAVDAAQAQINSAQSSLDQAAAQLDLKRAQARPADINAAKAQILSAQGQVQAAQANFENTIIRAPADGTITQVDIKVGEQASAMKEVLILQDVGNLHAEANISEANIASVQIGQVVDFTFDALGPDRSFTGIIQTINPASTVVSGVVNYKVIATITDIPEIKPGMTANMTVHVGQKNHVLAVPSSAVLNQNGKKYIRVIDDEQKKTYHQVEVQTGMEADGGLVEVSSGVSENQKIVTYIKQ